MKLAFVFLAIVGATFAAPHQQVEPHGDLRPALDRLEEHVDIPALLALVPQIAETEEGKAVLAYLRGPDFAELVEVLYAEDEFEKILDHLEENGLPATRERIAELREALGIPPRGSKAAPRSIQDLIDLISPHFDFNGLLATALDLISSDPSVQELLAHLSQPQVRDAYQRIKAAPSVKNLNDRLLAVGVDVNPIVELVEAILGWSQVAAGVAPKANNLRPALEQLLENVDVEKLTAVLEQVKETPEGKAVLEYLKGAEWTAIVDTVYAQSAFDAILDYLEANGLENTRKAIAALREALGLPPRGSVRKVQPRDLQEIVDLILATIDTEGLLADLLDLVSSDPAVQDLLAYLSQPENRDAYQAIKGDANVKALAQRLRETGIPVDELLAIVEAILGWGFRALH